MRLPKVCLALSGDTVEDMLATAESMARDNPFLEFRLDYLKQPWPRFPRSIVFLKPTSTSPPSVPAVVPTMAASSKDRWLPNWKCSPRPTPRAVRLSTWKFRAR